MTKALRGFDNSTRSGGRRDTATASIVITVDGRECEAVGRALQQFSAKRQDFIVTAALNKGMDRLYTQVKRQLGDWTGIRDKSRVAQDLRKRPASAMRWAAAVVVTGRHTRITPGHYGAKWKRQWPGVKHAAWKKATLAEGAFLKKGLAFKRVGTERLPIMPLWGPSMAREVERHWHDMQTLVEGIVRRYVLPEMTRQIDRALSKIRMK